jgi:2-oxoglutarate ferredoxin oxidoreductase subunit alpha
MNINDMTILMGGDAGQGLDSTGSGFCKSLARAGLHVFSVQDNRSRIRGGHNFYMIKTSDHAIVSWTEPVQVLIALTEESIGIHQSKLVPGGAVIFDLEMNVDQESLKQKQIKPIAVPLGKIAQDLGGSKVMSNTAALGALAGLTQFPIEYIISVIKDNFKKKGDKVVDVNFKVSQAAHDFVKENYQNLFDWQLQAVKAPERMVMNGNEAIALGALVGGCNFTVAYPMTPGTSIFEWLNRNADNYGIVSKQTEDEIAAINMAIGAAHVGARAIVPTSGGGFSLMVEALGLAGMTENPVVIVLAQRPGPSTGLATRTEQADLMFALHASQGEFPRFIIAPGDTKQCFEAGARAFNLAEKYQTPVIIMTDDFLATSNRTIDKSDIDFNSIKIERGKLLSNQDLDKFEGKYKRHAYVDDGISPRALPGHPKGVFRTTSDEHNEEGEIDEDVETRNKMHEKRMKKLETALSDMNAPILYGSKKADITFICWGSTLAPLQAAVNELNKTKKDKANILQFVDIWPLNIKKTRPYLDQAGKLIAVESNFTGQLASLLKMTMGVEVDDKILKYDGRPFSLDYILNHFDKV